MTCNEKRRRNHHGKCAMCYMDRRLLYRLPPRWSSNMIVKDIRTTLQEKLTQSEKEHVHCTMHMYTDCIVLVCATRSSSFYSKILRNLPGKDVSTYPFWQRDKSTTLIQRKEYLIEYPNFTSYTFNLKIASI